MSSDADQVFDLVAGKLRRKKGLCPPTPEEAAAAFKNAKAIPLSQEQKDSLVDSMLAEEWPARIADRQCRVVQPVDQEIDSEARVLCRNAGDEDEESLRLESELDARLLEEDDDEV